MNLGIFASYNRYKAINILIYQYLNSKFLKLVLSRCFIQLFQGKNRAVFADELLADIASTAHPDAALHAVFEGHNNFVMRIAEFVQNGLGKFYHDRWPAYDGVGIITCRRRFLFGDGGHKTGVVFPVRIIGSIHRDVHVDIITFFPFSQFIAIKQHPR